MKKFSKFLSVTIAAAIMSTCFAACTKDDKAVADGKKAETKSEMETETVPEETEEPVETTTEETEETIVDVEETEATKNPESKSGTDAVSVTILSEEDLEKESNYIMYEYSDSDYAANVKFSFSEGIKNFQFVDVEATVDNDGELAIISVDPAYELGDLDDMSVIIKLDLPEILPTNGIIITEKDGNAHFFVLLVSGEDGSPFLEEILAMG